jgi:hypothetical protein
MTIAHRLISLDSRDGRVPGLFNVDGGLLRPPTTASTQDTGTGASDYNVDVDPATVVLDGYVGYIEAKADLALDTASAGSAVLASGEARYYALVAWLDRLAGAVKFGLLKGTIAAVASAARLTDADVQARIGTSNPYVILGQTRCHRSADTTIAQRYENHDRLTNIWTGTTVASAPVTIGAL